MVAHNGEINTRRGNVNWMRAREADLQADGWGTDIELLKPIIQPGGSDPPSSTTPSRPSSWAAAPSCMR